MCVLYLYMLCVHILCIYTYIHICIDKEDPNMGQDLPHLHTTCRN